MLTQDQILRGFRHDVRGHLISLRNYLAQGQIQEAETYMDRIDETLTASESVRYHTRHPVADALLNDKASQLDKQKISLTVTGLLPEKLPISDFAFCQLMYNLLNNAQEACLRLPRTANAGSLWSLTSGTAVCPSASPTPAARWTGSFAPQKRTKKITVSASAISANASTAVMDF